MNPKIFTAIIAIFGTGFIAGYFLNDFLRPEGPSRSESIEGSKQIRQVGEYRYTNPLLECEVAEGIIDARKQNFREELLKEIEILKKIIDSLR